MPRAAAAARSGWCHVRFFLLLPPLIFLAASLRFLCRLSTSAWTASSVWSPAAAHQTDWGPARQHLVHETQEGWHIGGGTKATSKVAIGRSNLAALAPRSRWRGRLPPQPVMLTRAHPGLNATHSRRSHSPPQPPPCQHLLGSRHLLLSGKRLDAACLGRRPRCPY